MKHFSYFMLAALACLLGACNHDVQLSTEEIASSSESTTHFNQSLNEVFALMKEVYPSQYQKLVQRKDSYVPEFLTSANLHQCEQAGEYLRKVASNGDADVQVDTLVYIVNFGDESGFAIMSANPEFLGDAVIALTDSGSLHIEDFNITPREDLGDDYDANEPRSILVDLLSSSLTDLTKFKVNIEPTTPATPLRPYTYKYGTWQETGKLNPRVKIKLHQRDPFNRYCYDTNGNKALAGCVAIALVQLMAANEYPTSINGIHVNWTALKRGYRTDAVQIDLMARVIAEVGKQCDMTYGVTASSSDINKAKTCLSNYPKYKNLTVSWGEEANLDKVEQMLRNRRPVHIRASGHAWTIDGLLLQERKVEVYDGSTLVSTGLETRDLVHCVYGWNGLFDGYYNFKVFDFSTGPIETEAEDIDVTSSSKLNEGYGIITYFL